MRDGAPAISCCRLRARQREGDPDAKPTHPHFDHWILRDPGRFVLVVPWHSTARLRLVRTPGRPPEVRPGWALGVACDRCRNRVARRSDRPLDATAMGLAVLDDRRWACAIRG